MCVCLFISGIEDEMCICVLCVPVYLGNSRIMYMCIVCVKGCNVCVCFVCVYQEFKDGAIKQTY